ncbi:MAG: TonB-dependent receptor [Saprospiraceae bacterium]|nr:TonB-dependent receptor [Saprospiraceae bacterium]
MKRQKLTLYCLLSFITLSGFIQAQIPTQFIRGVVIDKDTRDPLIGANVTILNSNPEMGGITDLDGKFEIAGIPVGRVQIECTYIGYGSFLSDPFILNSAKAHELNIELIESAVTTGEVVVSAKKFGNEPLNELSILSARSFSVEETQRYAASANDPGRMVMGFPGVQPSRDSRSDIIIRGNSGIGMLWRLEGIDIPNPNHFARRGNSGGGITIFSVSMLSNSDFSTAAFPAEYGNATSGVFDIKFRKGNASESQHTFRAGLLGLDYSTEGPINKQTGSSYLLNYRYSTLGILNQLGLHLVGPRVDNTFQDLSFNLSFPSKDKKRYLTVWGMGGLSRERENAIEGIENWQSYSDYYTRDFNSNMGAVGATYFIPAGNDAYLKTNLAIMGQDILFQNDTLDTELRDYLLNDERYKETRIVLSSVWNKKINSKVSIKTGGIFTRINYDLFRMTVQENTPIDAEGNTYSAQAYVQLRYRPTEKLTINAGGHLTYFDLNNVTAVEPRLGIKYQISESHSLMAAWGMHSKILPIGNHFTMINGIEANRDANFLRSLHSVLGYEFLPGFDWKLRLEAYHQSLYDVPVSATPGEFLSILNTIDGFAKHELINTGTGQNIGLDLTIEKSFNKGIFLLISASIFDSEFTDASDRIFPTVFDSGFSATGMGGKEWNLKNGNQLSLSLKALYNGGQRLTPILEGAPVSRYSPDPILDDSRAFSEQVQDYFRTDLRLAFRKNNAKTAWWIALDVQNVTNRRNIDALNRVYDPDLNTWIYREQSGLTPILSFQIDF